jgi:hypothetical protein
MKFFARLDAIQCVRHPCRGFLDLAHLVLAPAAIVATAGESGAIPGGNI